MPHGVEVDGRTGLGPYQWALKPYPGERAPFRRGEQRCDAPVQVTNSLLIARLLLMELAHVIHIGERLSARGGRSKEHTAEQYGILCHGPSSCPTRQTGAMVFLPWSKGLNLIALAYDSGQALCRLALCG